MMGTTWTELQSYLHGTGRYKGLIAEGVDPVDGIPGRTTDAAIMRGFTDGPDTLLSHQDYVESAQRLHCPVSHIKAVAAVEAAGAGFFAGMPKILPERHKFSKLTDGRFDHTHPNLSYPKWGTLAYPKTQEARYEILLRMIRLDIWAGFSACSYGKFQILGDNHLSCGYPSPVLFAFAQAFDEATQLKCFEQFVIKNGLLVFLQNGIWTKFARGYNGPAYAQNRYDVKLAQAVRHFELSPERPA